MIVCPKCGFQQEAGRAECLRCGLIFDRYRPRTSQETPVPGECGKARPGLLRRVYRVFRWVTLAGAALTLALMLRISTTPPIEVTPNAGWSAETKVEAFQSTRDTGVPATLRLDEAELNALVRSRLPSEDEDPPTVPRKQASHEEDPAFAQVQSNVRDIRLHLHEDSVTAYVLFDLYGKEISLTLEGKLEFHDGCFRIVPTAGKLGTLPLMETTLRGAACRLFDSPENRDKFCLSPSISDVRVEEGSLVVASR
jgi:hypothetical protein